VTETKSRIVSFRLSAAEFADAEQVSRAHGYRSLSLFARTAITAFLSAPTDAGPHKNEINELRERIDVMATELYRISEQIRASHSSSQVAVHHDSVLTNIAVSGQTHGASH